MQQHTVGMCVLGHMHCAFLLTILCSHFSVYKILLQVLIYGKHVGILVHHHLLLDREICRFLLLMYLLLLQHQLYIASIDNCDELFAVHTFLRWNGSYSNAECHNCAAGRRGRKSQTLLWATFTDDSDRSCIYFLR